MPNQEITLTNQKAYEQKKIKLCLWGMFLAMAGAVGSLAIGVMTAVISNRTFVDGLPDDSWLCVMAVTTIVLGLADMLAGILFFVYNLITGRSLKEHARTYGIKGVWIMCISALCGGPIGTSLSSTSMNLCGVTVASCCMALTPMIVAIASKFMFKDALSGRFFFGVFVLVMGSFVTAIAPVESMPFFYVGVALGLLSSVGFSTESLFSSYIADTIDSNIGAALFRNFICGICELAIGLGIAAKLGVAGELFTSLIKTIFTPQVFPLFLIMAAVGLAFQIFAIYRALTLCGSARTQAMVYTFPLWSIPVGYLAAWIFKEDYAYETTPLIIIGAILVALGAVIVICKPKELFNLRNTD